TEDARRVDQAVEANRGASLAVLDRHGSGPGVGKVDARVDVGIRGEGQRRGPPGLVEALRGETLKLEPDLIARIVVLVLEEGLAEAGFAGVGGEDDGHLIIAVQEVVGAPNSPEIQRLRLVAEPTPADIDRSRKVRREPFPGELALRRTRADQGSAR